MHAYIQTYMHAYMHTHMFMMFSTLRRTILEQLGGWLGGVEELCVRLPVYLEGLVGSVGALVRGLVVPECRRGGALGRPGVMENLIENIHTYVCTYVRT